MATAHVHIELGVECVPSKPRSDFEAVAASPLEGSPGIGSAVCARHGSSSGTSLKMKEHVMI